MQALTPLVGANVHEDDVSLNQGSRQRSWARSKTRFDFRSQLNDDETGAGAVGRDRRLACCSLDAAHYQLSIEFLHQMM